MNGLELPAVQKSGAGVAPYSKWINRPLGRRLAAGAARAGLTPNQVTISSACCTFSALALVALVRPVWWLGLLVTALLLLGYALDSADGQLARMLGRSSVSGEWLDHVIDATKVCVLLGVVLVSLHRFTDASPRQLLVPIGYQTVSSVMFFCLVLIDQLRRSEKAAGRAPTHRARRDGLFPTLVATPADYAVLCLCFVLLGWETWFQFAYTCLFAVNVVMLAGGLFRWWREVRAMDRAET